MASEINTLFVITMNSTLLQGIARKASNHDLVDIVATKQFSDDELVIFETEVEVRGLQRELEMAVQARENTKNGVLASVSRMTDEDLLAYSRYNPFKFTEAELTVFKNEVKARGLEDELSRLIKAKEADDIAFKKVLDSSGDDVTELLHNFNEYTERKNPDISKRVREDKAKNRVLSLGITLIVGIVVTAIGFAFSVAADGSVIFIGAIVTGIACIARGIVRYLRN